jgi:hypothetical protein
MYGKWVITGIMVTLLSGCTAGFRPSLEDYKGSDAARIRAASDGNTALQFYEKQPSGCYKKVLERRITAGLAILGIPVTGNKKSACLSHLTIRAVSSMNLLSNQVSS